ncbi:hypothetical protein [Bacillus thuringiensis]|uniref:hypothetical protein n=1 Tax=Bacillus thuringiensis TaxID=1428 RepID=UPI0021B5521C|nr:hypothetical protein [Bacillus thuringiensis]
MSKIDNLKEWIHTAILDLSSAAFLLTMNPCPANIICHHCQRSIEGFLKGFIAFKEGIYNKRIAW